jgi:hypothetical protein
VGVDASNGCGRILVAARAPYYELTGLRWPVLVKAPACRGQLERIKCRYYWTINIALLRNRCLVTQREMPLSNAERQKRWRARRNAMPHSAAMMECCVLCLIPRADLDEEGIPVRGQGPAVVCEPCIVKAAAAIERREQRAKNEIGKVVMANSDSLSL